MTQARIIVEVRPVDQHCRFEARVAGRVVVKSSRTPFCAAARVLLAEGADPKTTLIMRHAGSDVDALRGPIGTAAKLTVRDDRGTIFVPYDASRLTEWRARTATEASADAGDEETSFSDSGADVGDEEEEEAA